MRKSVMIFGGISAAAAILLAAAFATAAWKRSAFDKDGRNYTGAVASAIVPQQNPDEPIRAQTPDLRASATADRIGSLARTARYLAWVRIERGKATLQVLVMQRDGKWLVHGFNLERGQKLAAE